MDVKVYDSDYFETETDILFICYDVGYVALILLLPFIVAADVCKVPVWSCIALWLLLTAFMMFVTYWKQHVSLVFKGDKLCIINHYGKEMVVYSDIGQDAFGFTQSKREYKRGLGSVFIFGTDYVFSGIRNFDAMRQYIATHFPERGNT
ncbi:MAG: hypothetical protein IJB19_05815 [Clostridia bacterium]|nr:hypothetical protein [Clostridia bacterium]